MSLCNPVNWSCLSPLSPAVLPKTGPMRRSHCSVVFFPNWAILWAQSLPRKRYVLITRRIHPAVKKSSERIGQDTLENPKVP
nr:MAG TPA: hypothetical protein [Caudoviricetes sp.]